MLSDNDFGNTNTKSFGKLKKAYEVIVFLVAVSSITSLSDLVFQWKGFIAEGLNFYQNYFVQPIQSISEKVGLTYSEAEIHSAIILSTTVTIGMKLLSKGQLVAYAEMNEQYGSEVKPNLLFFKVVSFVFPAVLWVSYGLSDTTIYLVPHLLLAFVYPFILSGTKEICARLTGNNSGYLERNRFSYTWNYYCYLALIALCIGVLAALNSGLTRIS